MNMLFMTLNALIMTIVLLVTMSVDYDIVYRLWQYVSILTVRIMTICIDYENTYLLWQYILIMSMYVDFDHVIS